MRRAWVCRGCIADFGILLSLYVKQTFISLHLRNFTTDRSALLMLQIE